jgi:DNA polymerase/3'-5' exonuclease PolX
MLDITVVRESVMPFSLLMKTGPASFVTALHTYIKNHKLYKNYTMSATHGMQPISGRGEVIQAQSEKDIFYLLGLKYLDPKNRDPPAVDVTRRNSYLL